jgi:hypothetical protein
MKSCSDKEGKHLEFYSGFWSSRFDYVYAHHICYSCLIRNVNLCVSHFGSCSPVCRVQVDYPYALQGMPLFTLSVLVDACLTYCGGLGLIWTFTTCFNSTKSLTFVLIIVIFASFCWFLMIIRENVFISQFHVCMHRCVRSVWF